MINLKCTFAVTAGLCSSLAYAQNQPHIILIMTDQQRGDAMGCMGNESVISPHLDALASEDMAKLPPSTTTKCLRC